LKTRYSKRTFVNPRMN